jgi:hypothetical protein
MTGKIAAISNEFIAISLYTIDYSVPKNERTEAIVNRLPFV